jgi:hypothetical protein
MGLTRLQSTATPSSCLGIKSNAVMSAATEVSYV